MFQPGSIAYKVPIIPMRYARYFSRFMEGRGINRGAFIEGTLITEDRLDDADGLLSMEEAISVVEKSQDLLDDECAPFQFGQSLGLAKHGLFGHSILCQKNAKHLMTTCIEHLRICFPLMEINMSHNSGKLTISLDDSWELGRARTFVAKVYLGSIYTMASLIYRNISLQLDSSTQLTKEAWKEVVTGSTIEFDAKKNQITMLPSEQPWRVNDEDISSILAENNSYRALDQHSTFNVLVKVRQQITYEPGRESTLERVAPKLGMCTRSVRRHLRLAGFSFQGIRNEVRETFATRYLTGTQLSLEKIAERLGYCDQASFTKAYRAWTGKTPGCVRRASTLGEASNSH